MPTALTLSPKPQTSCSLSIENPSYVPVYKTKLAAPTALLLRSSTPITDTYETFEVKSDPNNDKESTDNVKCESSVESKVPLDDKKDEIIEDDDDEEDEDNQFELTDDDLDEALADLALEDSQNEQIYENDPVSTENHYMPMTARTSILSPSHKMISTEMLAEENPYVEMTNNLPNLNKTNEEDSKGNYEPVCIATSEPVYMELAQGKQPSPQEESHSGKSTLKRKKKKTRKDLPDILKASQTESNDTSDADDEIDTSVNSQKSRSRFSLSDTFRPASYYLGVNNTSSTLANCIESSDSEIVSPPPIPSTTPPLETEEIFTSENFDTVKRRSNKLNLSFDQIPKIHSSNSSLNSNKIDLHKSSRLSLPDQLMKLKKMSKHERTLSSCSSNTSSDFDLYNKLKNTSPSYQSARESCSENESVEMRHKQGSDSELERQRSRRPLSEESISEIESMSEQFEEAVTNEDLDAYLHPLETSDLSLYQNTTTVVDILIKPPEIFRNENDEHYYGNINFVSSTDSIEKVGDKTPIHSRQSSNISTSSVPYYYHELFNRDTPNNQRDIQQPNTEISLIHNPLTSARSFSMEILSEKDQSIDSKNLYTMKPNIEKLSYSTNKNLKTQITGGDGLAGLANNNFKNNQQKIGIKNNEASSKQISAASSVAIEPAAGGGEQLWEEDSLWRESLRRVSQRHARSLDDLDRIDCGGNNSSPPGKSKLTRDVTYVNDTVVNSRRSRMVPPIKEGAVDDNDVYVQLAETNIVPPPLPALADVYESLREDHRKSVEIDRETLRQWDSMSCGLMRNTSISGVKSSVNSQMSLKSTNYLREISGNEAIKPTTAQHSTNEKKATDNSSYSIKF